MIDRYLFETAGCAIGKGDFNLAAIIQITGLIFNVEGIHINLCAVIKSNRVFRHAGLICDHRRIHGQRKEDHGQQDA